MKWTRLVPLLLGTVIVVWQLLILFIPRICEGFCSYHQLQNIPLLVILCAATISIYCAGEQRSGI